MKEKLYYLKWDVDNKSFLLDISFKMSDFVYGIKKVQVTEEQANEFADRMELRYTVKGKEINLPYLEYEFEKFFHVCHLCGKVTSHTAWQKRHRLKCYDCYQATIRDNWKETQKENEEIKRVERLKVYVKTDQGKADTIGIKAIKTNIIVQLMRHFKTQKDMAEMLNMTEANASRMLKSDMVSIRIEHLYKIAEWLFVPLDLLLKVPRGSAPLKKKNRIPIVMYRKPMRTIMKL